MVFSSTTRASTRRSDALITADRRRYNTDILGCVVERASGLSLDRFIAGRITKPLGLNDTHFFLPAAGGALDGVRIISPRTVALMTTNQVGMLHSTRGLGFDLGFQTVDRYGPHSLSSVGRCHAAHALLCMSWRLRG